ncbi:hypothetical protein [Catenulispora acidiphila]|nr:hypothetical protein [Catenulispora acidiphila]
MKPRAEDSARCHVFTQALRFVCFVVSTFAIQPATRTGDVN